ncbi:ribonuclease I [Acetobacter sp. AN02]|uniref:ribonuclease T2 family protein n=1 Tax=Acetobacter sp. AN02 TaxID=2894186 RepID=UPI0024343BB5|nr:ribonuclease I [Acetobacter sp. AN02]MDG6094056.1 ribonuclease I [Acetobacter sp. AN02]
MKTGPLTRTWLMLLLFTGLAGCTQPRDTQDSSLSLATPQHAGFGHYTLALTWQPGFCNGPHGPSCTPDQPRTPLIGLHGLWASRPPELIRNNTPVTQWWQKGCALYEPDQPVQHPALSPETADALNRLVPRTQSDLTAHEYSKHVRCFGTDPERFFQVAIALHDRFTSLQAAHSLDAAAGTTISRQDILNRITAGTGPVPDRAIQFRCENTTEGRPQLTQIWFTLRPDALSDFPHSQAFMSSPQMQDNCPARFLLPAWPGIH